jgi:Flp pilus assembly protein TadD
MEFCHLTAGLDCPTKLTANGMPPPSRDVLAGLAKAHVRKGRPAGAIPYLEQALKLQPDSASMHYQRGQAYLKTGRREEAEKEVAQAGRLQAQEREKQEGKISGKLPAPQAPADKP